MEDTKIIVDGVEITPQLIAVIETLKDNILKGGNSMTVFKDMLQELYIAMNTVNNGINPERQKSIAAAMYYFYGFAKEIDDLIASDEM